MSDIKQQTQSKQARPSHDNEVKNETLKRKYGELTSDENGLDKCSKMSKQDPTMQEKKAASTDQSMASSLPNSTSSSFSTRSFEEERYVR